MPQPATAPWGLAITDSDFRKLKAGLQVYSMDDRWHVSFTEQRKSDTVTIHIVRHGSYELYSIVIKPGDGCAVIETINWAQDQGGNRITEGIAKMHVVMLTRRNMECEFEGLPDCDSEDFFDEPAPGSYDTPNFLSNGTNTNGTNGTNGTSGTNSINGTNGTNGTNGNH
ncbi:hypothetical protein CH063_09821 [Colletotrichum higginsianum]|uniref:Uncharacterized protein n=2 Tax=Colletotrichum higginsianum TaxID=80884 RepID=H1VF24_COLHI|nr:uncharacterized protein CH63R_09806 [Colletotrichum higginsianum IMI 349063]OBR05686.1 hypothetical protein CH63R_09806 [Colletotrichum higginsianum IMI 349063]CCF38827.1 hypothetical protein CH063_09821 [Colletotrichum higginsianum]